MIPLMTLIAGSVARRVIVATLTGAVIGKKVSDAQHKKELEQMRAEVEDIKRKIDRR